MATFNRIDSHCLPIFLIGFASPQFLPTYHHAICMSVLSIICNLLSKSYLNHIIYCIYHAMHQFIHQFKYKLTLTVTGMLVVEVSYIYY
jgi:hypothetical protein